MNDLPNEMHPAYFQTRFRFPTRAILPETFAIVSGYATTGEVWTDEENEQADVALRRYLERNGYQPIRVDGYDPKSNHCEPSWIIDGPLERARQIGATFRQIAVYWVEHGKLFVTSCKPHSQLYLVANMADRIDTLLQG
ncbi:MAG: DUF3293 domain-containing protein [Pirellulales bacterium]